MTKVRRFDSGSLNSPVKLKNGWLKADAYLTRIGVFSYLRKDGTTFREFRPPEEVFRTDSLESLRQVPLTLEHPTEGDGMLNADNAKEYTVGNVGHGRPDWESGCYVQGPVLVTDSAAVKAVEDGKQQLSMGYQCEVDPTPGEYLGQPYDGVQRNITYNHCAIVGTGRAGAEVKIKMDAADAVQVEPKELLVKVRLDGLDIEVSDIAGQAIEKEKASYQAKLDAAEAKRKEAETKGAEAQARADAAEAKAKELSDPKALLAKVNQRAALISQAREVLGAETKLDDAGDLEIKKLVLTKLSPDVKLDGQSEVYVSAYFDATMKNRGTPTPTQTPALSQARADASGVLTSTTTEPAPDPAAAKKRMEEESRNAWKIKPS